MIDRNPFDESRERCMMICFSSGLGLIHPIIIFPLRSIMLNDGSVSWLIESFDTIKKKVAMIAE
jgi:hypothetical protein